MYTDDERYCPKILNSVLCLFAWPGMVNVFLFVLLVLKFDRVVFISRRKPDRRVRRRPPNCRLPGQLLKPGLSVHHHRLQYTLHFSRWNLAFSGQCISGQGCKLPARFAHNLISGVFVLIFCSNRGSATTVEPPKIYRFRAKEKRKEFPA